MGGGWGGVDLVDYWGGWWGGIGCAYIAGYVEQKLYCVHR